MKIKICIFIVVLVSSIFILAQTINSQTSGEVRDLTADEIDKIQVWIEKNIKDGKIPGVSVVIIKEGSLLYNKGFGYANVDKKIPVTSDTLFEIGSNSKAFTALGILKLEKEGKISLNDSINQYIPWFQMKYTGEYRGEKINKYVEITLKQLLYHTSGIPFKSIGDIPISNDKEALYNTVRTQVGKELEFYPGEKFLYATINYDILGLVIEKVSGESFEDYMKKNILEPLGLNNTYLHRSEVPQNLMSTGYKLKFLKQVEYNAPLYRGNTPAGYFISNAEDLAKWIKIQMGIFDQSELLIDLIEKSHIPDRTVLPSFDGSSYGAGWQVHQKGLGEISHGGANPNFSSSVIIRPEEKLGVGVLSNINSEYTDIIAQGIMNIFQGVNLPDEPDDLYKKLDGMSLLIVIIAIPFSLTTIFYLIILIAQIVKKKSSLRENKVSNYSTIFFVLLLIMGIGFSFYKIPYVFFSELPWSFFRVWAPSSFITAILILFFSIVIFFIYYIFSTLWRMEKEKGFYPIIVLSMISGFGNALIVFFINESLNNTVKFQGGLLMLFTMSIIIYVYCQRLVRRRLILVTNNLVYEKRMNLVKNILATRFEIFEKIGGEKIYTALNNDTETISNFANITIGGVTSLITLICCFVYLGIINVYGLLLSGVVILISGALYYFVGRSANKLWEETRDIQNTFFKFINDLINGFKELNLNKEKRSQFKSHMEESCNEYRNKRVIGDLKFADSFVVGELLFTFVVGTVAFIFPVLFDSIKATSLRNYVFVFLYMTGPVNNILEAVPGIIGLKISWKRINGLFGELLSNDFVTHKQITEFKDNITISLRDVEYRYTNDQGNEFKIGPISCSFSSGEITFITGGNGSGKSTLAKILTGLYVPTKGSIHLNDHKVMPVDLGKYYSVVFSDFYMFNKLYGIDYEKKQNEIVKYLKVLGIDDKLEIKDGVFSTTKLSSGQRKRLALLISYLEDKPIFLFDEWAADQDPEFRAFFYDSLILELKKRGKCVIAITHDDRYFDIADNIVKMDMGKIVQKKTTEDKLYKSH